MIDIEKLLINMENSFSQFQDFQGWMIGKCSMWISWTEEEHEKKEERISRARILRRNSKWAILQASIDDLKLEAVLNVLLIRPVLTKSIQNTLWEKKGRELGKLFFSQEQLNCFLDAVSDNNPIHKGEDAIIPAFMIINYIVEQMKGQILKKEKNVLLETRFITPLKVGERAELWIEEMDQGNGWIYGRREDKELFRISINTEK